MRRMVLTAFFVGLMLAPTMGMRPARGQNSPSDSQAEAAPTDRGLRELKDIDRRIQPPGDEFPPDESIEIIDAAATEKPFALYSFYWEAPEIWHRPLYFDDVTLERYGQTPDTRYQPFLSGAHFFLQFPILPYKMTVDRPFECKTNLGYYRPGSPTPCVGQRLPIQSDAALVEATTWLALIFVLP